MPTTLEDIARAAGVDRSTVCRVLKGMGRTSPETGRRIMRLAREMNYTPNPIARSLILGKSSFVGVVADHTIIPVFEKLISPIEQALRAHGMTMLFVSSPSTADGEEAVVRQLVPYNIAGLIAVRSSVSPETGVYEQFIGSGGKMVVVNKPFEGLRAPQVVTNDYLHSRLAAEHLIALGHRRIAHLSIDSQSISSRQRDKGFRDALSEAGLEADESLIIPTSIDHETASSHTLRLLRTKKPPTAIVARYDVVAMGACDACIRQGLSVPGDVSITGVADVWRPSILKVALTTISYPYLAMASKGVEILVKMIEGACVEPETIMMGAELVVRDSTGPPKIS